MRLSATEDARQITCAIREKSHPHTSTSHSTFELMFHNESSLYL
jgi:hypothetical protein